MKFFSQIVAFTALTASLVSAVPVEAGEAIEARAPPGAPNVRPLVDNLVNSMNMVGQATGQVTGALANFNRASPIGQAYTILTDLTGLDRGLRNTISNAQRINPFLDYPSGIRIVGVLQRTIPGIGDLLNKDLPAKAGAFRTFPALTNQYNTVQNAIRSDAILVLNTIYGRVQQQDLRNQINSLKNQLQRRLS